MAFGKDDSQLANMGTYRQMAMTQVNHGRSGRSGGGGGGMPTFVDRFKPSTVEEDLIRLIAGKKSKTLEDFEPEPDDFENPS